jgi:hypothetical protein
LAFQEVLKVKDTQMKLKFADQFPTRLPDSTADVPGHMFHRIWLKTPTRSITARDMQLPRNTRNLGSGCWTTT